MTPADLALQKAKEEEPGFGLLFKYYTINDYSIDALQNGYVYFSSYEQLNDPMDPMINLLANRDNAMASVLASSGLRVFCVTENPANPLMWAHYGNAGRGMCVGYAVGIAHPSFFRKVEYIEEIHGERNVLDFAYIKFDEWEYEQEWRSVQTVTDPKVSDIVHPFSVFLGSKCSDADRKRVQDVLPETVEHFQYLVPEIIDHKPHSRGLDVIELVEKFGHLPSIEELLASEGST